MKQNLASGIAAAFIVIMIVFSCGKPSNDGAAGTNDTVPPPSGEQEFQSDQTAPQPDTVKDTVNHKP